MTLDEAGVSLGLSRSWTSRLHARALEQLQKIIRESADHDEFKEKKKPEVEEISGKITKEKTKDKNSGKKAKEKRPKSPSEIGINSTRC
jgi:hypothetical protein